MSSRKAVILIALVAFIALVGVAGATARNKLIGKWVKHPLELLGMRGAKFTPDDGFLRRRFQKKHIIEAVSLHQRGFSLGKVKEHLHQQHGIEVSRWMISLWCRDYFRMMDKFRGMVKPDIKKNAHSSMAKVKDKNWGAYG